ncbi:MAG: glycosyltransferase [Luteibaculum sp.]
MQALKGDIVIFGLARWDGEYSSTTLALAQELSKQNRVFYLDNPLTLFSVAKDFKKSLVKKRWKASLLGKHFVVQPFPKLSQLHVVYLPLVLPINFLPKSSLFRVLKAFNDWLIYRRLDRLWKIKDLKNATFINIYNPIFPTQLPKRFGANPQVYFTVDKISASDYLKKHGPWLEKLAMENADFGLATSRQLQSDYQHLNTVHYLPNAADISLFARSRETSFDCPDEIKNLQGDIILYTGNLSIREDFVLLLKISKAYPQKHLVLVGPINTKRHLEIGLDKRENVHFLGPKKLEELPAYLQHAQVAIIPFLCNALTAAIYPLKINEYLATGIPVVSTAFSKDIAAFQEVIYLSQSHDEFLANLEKAIQEDSKEKQEQRFEFAANNTWENRADLLRTYITDYRTKVTLPV